MNSTNHGPSDSGYVIALGALLMIPLMIAVGFAVDLGSWVTQASKEQRAADSAALAGVVWLPDTDKARTVALEAAAKNGYCDSAAVPTYCSTANATVTVEQAAGNRLRVVVESDADLFFASVVLDDFKINRRAVAEYVLSVPLGSPKNHLGTGDMLDDSAQRENVWLSINGTCTRTAEGDQKASRATTNSNCEGVNADWTATNYELYIDLPESRTTAMDVILYDPAYTAASSDADDFNPGTPSGTGSDAMEAMYTLHEADLTPFDDTDNPPAFDTSVCTSTGDGHQGTATFAGGTTVVDGGYTFNASGIANSNDWWLLCRIPTSAPAGRWVLNVQNRINPSPDTNFVGAGSNNYAVAVTPATGVSQTNPSGELICDSRANAACPRVYAKEYLSYRLKVSGGFADFFLAEISKDHAGKKAVLTLWDPAEGSNRLEIVDPEGALQTFDYTASPDHGGSDSGTGVDHIDTSTGHFHDHLVTVTWDLPNSYDPSNDWWKVRYHSGPNPTDRTTWSLTLLGDPVRLIE